MKLRIRGNTIRIRVSQTEMTEIVVTGLVQDFVEFGPGSRLSYRVEVAPKGTISASYEGSCVSVVLTQDAVERWQSPDEISIKGEQPLSGGGNLKILVEKDFACLSPREEAEDGDGDGDGGLFPNPDQIES
jgi:hypothetical protein